MENYFEKKMNYGGISFRYAEGKSLFSGKEIHGYHEILYYKSGCATLLTEQFNEPLRPDTLLFIPKETYHRFSIKKQREYTRLVISFPDSAISSPLIEKKMTDIRIFTDIPPYIKGVLDRMCARICEGDEAEEVGLFLYSAFLMLFSEIGDEASYTVTPTPHGKDQLISRCLAYLNDNFTADISVSETARKMNVSKSVLHSCFKKNLGISFYKYVTEKRLIYAHRLICNGDGPTKIYSLAGFADYPTFYKAYVKMFSHPPSEDLPKQGS